MFKNYGIERFICAARWRGANVNEFRHSGDESMAVDPNVDSDGELSVNKQHSTPASTAPAAPTPAAAPQPQPQPPAQVWGFCRLFCYVYFVITG